MSKDKVITATLVRGRTYIYKARGQDVAVQYDRDKPVVVTADVAEELENLSEEVRDTDGEVFDKYVFEIKRGVTAPKDDSEDRPVRRRLRRPVEDEDDGDDDGRFVRKPVKRHRRVA